MMFDVDKYLRENLGKSSFRVHLAHFWHIRKKKMANLSGFGSEEIDTAIKIIKECYEAVKDAEDKKTALNDIEKKYQQLGEGWKSLPRDKVPARYSYFWGIMYDIFKPPVATKYFIEFTFHHISRRHPLDPDGWAAMITHWILWVYDDEIRIYRETRIL